MAVMACCNNPANGHTAISRAIKIGRERTTRTSFVHSLLKDNFLIPSRKPKIMISGATEAYIKYSFAKDVLLPATQC